MKSKFTTTIFLFLFLFFSTSLNAQRADPENNFNLSKATADVQPKGSDTLFVNGTGDDFDLLIRREERTNGRAKYKVVIDRFYSGKMQFDSDGFLTNLVDLIPGRLIPVNALLTLRVFDVDHLGTSQFKPEVDHIYVNGKLVKKLSGKPATLTSGHKTWAINSFIIPIQYLKFPQNVGTETTKPSAENIIEIDVDQYAQRWQVKCDWISIEIKSPIRPVLMIHGFIADPSTWNKFTSFFSEDGNPYYVPPANVIDGVGSIANNAVKIFEEMPKVLNKFGVDKVNMLVHSKGGLDSRLYLRYFGKRNNVESLIQLATPNHGSEVAEKGLWLAKKTGIKMPAAEQLSTSWLRDNFNFRPIKNPSNSNIIQSYTTRFTEEKYKSFIYILTGTKHSFTYGGLLNPHDKIVSALSTTLPWNYIDPNNQFLPTIETIYPHVPFLRSNNGEFPLDHSEMHDKREVYDKVNSILMNYGLNSSNSIANNLNNFIASKVSFNNNDTLLLRTVYNNTDSIKLNEQRIVNINVETTTEASFLAMNMEGGFSFSLKDPSNSIIDSTNQNYFSTYDEFGKMAEYKITNPQTGTWQIIIDPEPVGRIVLNEVSIISNKYLTVETDSVSYFINQTFPITSEFIDGSQPVLGANVYAEILKHDGSVDSLTLYDDGTHGDSTANDGKYTNSYQGTSIPGTLDIKSRATKNDVSRVYTKHITIVPNSATLNGTYSENSIDSDSDSLIDSLVINIGVNVNTPGNYTLSADLVKNDTTITSATFNSLNSTQLNAGSQNIQLLFGGSDIFSERHDGPYLLSNVLLTDLKNNVQVDFSEQPFTTQVYTINQFERPILFLTGNNSETTNTVNGKLQGITVNFDVDILNTGFYEYNAELTDTNGNFIAWAKGQRTISSVGVTTLSLFFEGNDINNKRLNGPYSVKNLSIYSDAFNSPDANLFVNQLMTTSNYNFADFKGKLIVANVINKTTSTPMRNVNLFLNGTEDSNSFKVFAFDSTNSNGQALFGGINNGFYNLYASKDTLISDTTFFTIYLDSTVITIEMDIPNTFPVFTNLPDTIIIPSNSNDSITIWNFISDNESSDTTLVFDFSATPDTLNFSFNDTTGVLTISSEDSTYSGNVILRIRADDTFGGVVEDSILINFTSVTGIDDIQNIIPKEFSLSQNYPNPFNPTTKIQFGLPKKSNVEIMIYNVLGQQVIKLVNKEFSAGFHTVTFNANKLASGVYFYRIIAGDFIQSKKMILLK